MYSSPPLHGSRLAELLLTDDELNAAWRVDLKVMAGNPRMWRESARGREGEK